MCDRNVFLRNLMNSTCDFGITIETKTAGKKAASVIVKQQVSVKRSTAETERSPDARAEQ